MMAILKIKKNKGMEYLSGLMEANILAILKMIWDKDTDACIGQMAINIKVNGLMVNRFNKYQIKI